MARFSASIATAAAYGITERMIGTWSPHVGRTPRLLVPVELDALVVRPSGNVAPMSWADCALRPPPAGTPLPVSRRSMIPPPFAEQAARPPGVYLHWALPDALTHGTQLPPAPKQKESTTFPVIPDRWLVLRLSPPTTRDGVRRAVRGWVLEANGATSTAHDLDGWTEAGPGTDASLTALGIGDAAWAAYYDNVVNRLAFYDDLSDVQSGPLAYAVCGWWADPTLDPLGTEAVKSLSDFDTRLKTLAWTFDASELHRVQSSRRAMLDALSWMGLATRERGVVASQVAWSVGPTGSAPAPLDAWGHPVSGFYTTNGAWWPSLTLLHGSVVAIGWPSEGWAGMPNGLLGGPVGGPPSAADVRVIVGTTLTDAVSAAVAATAGRPDEARVLEAFTLGALSELDTADGQARVDALLHATEFASFDGGSVTETIRRPPTPATPPLPTPTDTPDPGIFPPVSTGVGVYERAFDNRTAAATSIIVPQPVATPPKYTAEERAEISIAGGLWSVIGAMHRPPPPPPQPAGEIEVQRSLPRFYLPAEPVILLQGAGRSPKHGGDGRYTQDGTLECRLTGFGITEASVPAGLTETKERPSMRGADVLSRGVESGSVPPECQEILEEVVLLDPGTALSAAQSWGRYMTAVDPAIGGKIVQVAQRFTVEQTAWWVTRNPLVDHGPLIAKSGLTGALPSPIAVTPPVRPWTPLHLDWEVEYLASPGGVRDWALDETDFDPTVVPSPDATGVVLAGRTLLTGGAARVLAQSIHTAINLAARTGGTAPLPPSTNPRYASALGGSMLAAINAIHPVATPLMMSAAASRNDPGVLADIATTLETMDVLTGALDDVTARMRGSGAAIVPLRAGFLRIRRLRLVDGFGQFVDLSAGPAVVWTDAMTVAAQADIAGLPPRFTARSRLLFRFTDAGGAAIDATADVSPVCGYLMPNHLDGALELFDDAGANLGFVRPDADAGVVWEDAPGLPSTVGQTGVRAVSNTAVSGLVQALIDWGISDATGGAGPREDALSACLRVIDSTLWTVDPFSRTGDEHLSLLVGHPVVVMRARVTLQVEDSDAREVVAQTRVPLRLGALTHWTDGLLGYFVNDDYTTLYCANSAAPEFAREVGPNRGFLQQIAAVPNYYQTFADDLGAPAVAAGRSPVTHPYVAGDDEIWIQPNQDLRLTLLVEPLAVVHATAGLLPRKEIGMRRAWVSDALARLAPTFRFGPVLVDPKRIRMPVPSDLHGSWSWDHRADVATWAEDAVINATGDALLPDDPSVGMEGWLRIVPKVDNATGGG